MKKAILDDRVCFVAEDIEEATRLLNALSIVRPFYVEYNGEIIEIKNIRDVSVTIIFEADTRTMGGVANESVCS